MWQDGAGGAACSGQRGGLADGFLSEARWINQVGAHPIMGNPLSRSDRRTAVEVQRIVDNMMDALMDMRLRLPVAMVEQFCGGIDDAIQKLTTNMLYHIGSADVLIPPVPPLTR